MEISFDSSQRLDNLKFPLSILIVVIHAKVAFDPYPATVSSTVAVFIQHLFSDVIALCAVPLFFVISGYLLFSKYECSLNGYGKLIRRRVRSLLVPYFLFNCGTLLMFHLMQSYPQTIFLFNSSEKVAGYTLHQFASAITGIGGQAAAYHLWFIKHIFVMTVYSPVLWFMLKKAPFAGLVIAGVCYGADVRLSWLLFTSKSLFYFYLGGCFAVNKIKTEWSDTHIGVVVGYYTLIACSAALLLTMRILVSPAAEGLIVIPGMITMWALSGKSIRNRHITRLTGALLPYALFVYLAQLPLLNLIQKLLVKTAAPLTGGKVLAIYGATASLTLGICLGVGYLLRRFTPHIYSVLVGGRG